MERRTLLTSSQNVQPIGNEPLDQLVRLQARVVEMERKKIESALLPGETLEQAKHRLHASSEVEKGARGSNAVVARVCSCYPE